MYGLFQSLIVDNFLCFIYLLHLGYSATLVGSGNAVYFLTLVLLNIPSSWIVDHFRKRTVLFIASIAKTLLFTNAKLREELLADSFNPTGWMSLPKPKVLTEPES